MPRQLAFSMKVFVPWQLRLCGMNHFPIEYFKVEINLTNCIFRF